jgi:hypothetical protein
MLEFHYDLGAGPVDFYALVYRPPSFESRQWMDNLAELVEEETQDSKIGSFGGYDPDPGAAYCYYAYNGDGELPSDAGVGELFYYYVNIRDMIYQDANPEGGTWDWSRSQPYSFCIEEAAPGCLDPCTDYGGSDGGVNCGAPVN